MHVYQVLKRPIITEKTMEQLEPQNQYAFEVDIRANKHQVKEAVEAAFGVRVRKVRIMRMPAKYRRYGRRLVKKRPMWKKAIVTLEPGDSIQFFEGV
ncbi:MAG TPA: 50S ribosomal protein L23 [Caldilineae bacterium]|nr:50S ribosomal protein L23 [Caldilineae bacterium]